MKKKIIFEEQRLRKYENKCKQQSEKIFGESKLQHCCKGQVLKFSIQRSGYLKQVLNRDQRDALVIKREIFLTSLNKLYNIKFPTIARYILETDGYPLANFGSPSRIDCCITMYLNAGLRIPYQKSAMCNQKDDQNGIILIISNTFKHSYLF